MSEIKEEIVNPSIGIKELIVRKAICDPAYRLLVQVAVEEVFREANASDDKLINCIKAVHNSTDLRLRESKALVQEYCSRSYSVVEIENSLRYYNSNISEKDMEKVLKESISSNRKIDVQGLIKTVVDRITNIGF